MRTLRPALRENPRSPNQFHSSQARMTWQFLATGKVRVNRDRMSDHFIPEVTLLFCRSASLQCEQYLLECQPELRTTRGSVLRRTSSYTRSLSAGFILQKIYPNYFVASFKLQIKNAKYKSSSHFEAKNFRILMILVHKIYLDWGRRSIVSSSKYGIGPRPPPERLSRTFEDSRVVDNLLLDVILVSPLV